MMGFRSFRVAEDRSLPSERLYEHDALATDHGRAVARPDPVLNEGDGAPLHNAPPITDILRGSDLDALLHGMTGGEFLHGGWADELPTSPVGWNPLRETDFLLAADKADTALVLPPVPDGTFQTKDADIAQVLPGVVADDFLLSKDAHLPLVLPGEDEGSIGLQDQVDNLEGLSVSPNHMLTLAPDGGFLVGTDDFGRLNDHDGWLF